MTRIMNPRSLENLKLPKKRGLYHNLPQEKIDKLFVYIADEGVSLKAAAEKVGIAFETAKKYFEEGDKRRGIKPLRRRLVVYQDKVTETFDKELLARRKILIKLVQGTITKLEDQVKSGEILKKASLTQLDRLIRLEVFLSGQAKTHEQQLLSAEDIRSLEQSEGSD